jgi:uncharacterized membrane protein
MLTVIYSYDFTTIAPQMPQRAFDFTGHFPVVAVLKHCSGFSTNEVINYLFEIRAYAYICAA